MQCHQFLGIALFACFICYGDCDVFLETHATLPAVFSKSTLKRIFHFSSALENGLVLQVPLTNSAKVLHYNLAASKPMSFPVYSVDKGGGRVHAKNHSSVCHYAASLVDDTSFDYAGSVSLCNGIVEGVIPLNATHMGYIYPSGGAANNGHIVNVYPQSLGRDSWMKLDAAYASANRQATPSVSMESLQTFLPARLRPLLRKRRSAGPFVRLDSPPRSHIVTKDGPFMMELYLVADNDFYAIHSSNTESVIAAAQNIINFVNNRFRTFNLHIVITGLEIWKAYPAEYNFSTFSDPRKTVDSLMRYVSSFPLEWHFDCVHLLHGRTTYYNGKSAGMAKESTMCSRPFCVGFSIVTRDSRNSATAGIIMSHELAHNLGSGHDEETPGCKCPASACIMSANLFGSPLHQLPWSDCSTAAVGAFLDSGYRHCLLEPNPWAGADERVPVAPPHGWTPQCGNGIVEAGEACDCGGEHGCAGNPCCQAATCQLAANATCASGSCCDLAVCRPAPSGHECRRAVSNECDLPEYCDGFGSACPADVTALDGVPCNSGSNFCWAGRCPSADAACETIWGLGAKSQGSDCYSLNAEYQDGAAIFGCRFQRISSSTTVRSMCGGRGGFIGDTRCGRLMCQAPQFASSSSSAFANGGGGFSSGSGGFFLGDGLASSGIGGAGGLASGQARLPGYHTPLSHSTNGAVCRAVAYDYGPLVRDPGLAPNGIGCGNSANPDRACVAGSCESAADVRDRRLTALGLIGAAASGPLACVAAGGRVNSRGNCHCPTGKAPPDCHQSGHGGSLDSGPAGGGGGGYGGGPGGHGGASVAGIVAVALLGFVVIAVSVVLLLRYKRQVKERLCDLRCLVELRRRSSGIFAKQTEASTAAAASAASSTLTATAAPSGAGRRSPGVGVGLDPSTRRLIPNVQHHQRHQQQMMQQQQQQQHPPQQQQQQSPQPQPLRITGHKLVSSTYTDSLTERSAVSPQIRRPKQMPVRPPPVAPKPYALPQYGRAAQQQQQLQQQQQHSTVV